MSKLDDRGHHKADPHADRHAHRALKVVRNVTDILTTAPDENTLLEHFCRVLVEVGHYRLAWVAYFEQAPTPRLHPVAHAGHEAGYLALRATPLETTHESENPVAQALRSARPATARISDRASGNDHWHATARQHGYAACIALPLHWSEEMFGVLTVYADEESAFDAGAAGLLAAVADKLSVGIHFTRLAQSQRMAEDALRNEKESQEALAAILRVSLQTAPLEEKLDEVLAILFDVSWLQIEQSGAVFLAEPERERLHLVARRHLHPALHRLCDKVPYGQCLCGLAAATGETVFRSTMDEDHTTTYEGITDHGHYCQPIRTGERLLGMLTLYVAAGHVRTEAEGRFVQAVADTLAGIIEREEMDLERHRLATVIEASPDFVGITGVDGEPLYFNRAARELLPCQGLDDEVSCAIQSVYPQWAERLLRETAIPAALKEGSWAGDTVVRRPDGREFPVSHLILAPRDAHGDVQFIANVCRDISDRKEAEAAAQALALREKQFANTVINGLPGIFFVLDNHWRLVRWNGNLGMDLGYSNTELQTMNLPALVVDAEREALRASLEAVDEADGVAIEAYLQRRDGDTAPYLINILRLAGQGGTPPTIIGVGFDISDRKRMELELERRATRDELTGAFNRSKGMELLEYEIEKAGRYRRPLSIVVFDIDRFKSVNDSYGHGVGDEVLRKVVAWTEECVRAVDMLARWGGEEFVLLAPETPLSDAVRIAEKLRSRLPLEPVGPVARVTASFGVAQYRSPESVDELLKRADEALYHAKQTGRDRVCETIAP